MEDHLRPLTEAMGGGLWEWDCRRIMERVRGEAVGIEAFEMGRGERERTPAVL